MAHKRKEQPPTNVAIARPLNYLPHNVRWYRALSPERRAEVIARNVARYKVRVAEHRSLGLCLCGAELGNLDGRVPARCPACRADAVERKRGK